MSIQPRHAETLVAQRLSFDSQTPISEQPMTLQDVIRVLKRRQRVALIFAGGVLGLVLIYLACATRRYAGEATLEFDKQNADMLGLNGGTGGNSDTLDYNITLQTQAEILESDTLGLQVIKELNLEQTEDFKPKFNLLGFVESLFSSTRPSEENLPLEEAPGRRVAALKKFHKNLKVDLVTGSRMIQVTFLSPDRYLASTVANRLLNDYVTYSFQTRYLATSQATGWLSKQLDDIKLQMESDQARAAKLQREAEIFGIGPDKHNAILSHLEALDSALATAQANRIVKEAGYRAMQTGDPEVIAGLANSSSMGVPAGLGPTNELFTIQTLRNQESQQKARLAELTEKYGARNPQVIEATEQLQSMEQSIKEEGSRLGQRAKSDLDIAVHTERTARKVFEDQKTLAEGLTGKTIQYEIAANEAASSQQLYDGLLRKLKEAGVTGSLQATNAHIVDPARVPDKPATPKVLLLVAGGLAFALFGGVCAAVLVEAIDDSVTSLNEIGAITGLPLLGFVPRYKSLNRPKTVNAQLGSHPIVPAETPRATLIVERDAMIGECFRSVRTAVLLAGGREKPLQVIAVSSPLPGEGKTTTSLNLALVLAQQGSRVLLVDADMRCSTLERELIGGRKSQGLSTALRPANAGNSDSQIVPSPIHENLHFLASGPHPQYPADLLGSPQMVEQVEKWRKEYQFVIIDTPPVLLVTDTVVLAPAVDGVVIVARHGVTSRDALIKASTLLTSGGAHVLGVLLNAIEKSSDQYYGYYGHEKYFRSARPVESRLS